MELDFSVRDRNSIFCEFLQCSTEKRFKLPIFFARAFGAHHSFCVACGDERERALKQLTSPCDWRGLHFQWLLVRSEHFSS